MIAGKRGLIMLFAGLILLGLAGCGGGSAGSSSSSGSINGVVDIGGERKENVEVCLVAAVSNAKFYTTTDGAGHFSFANVVPGKYYVLYQEDGNTYTEPKLGESAPKDVFVGQTVTFDIRYTADEMPPGLPE